MDVTITSKVVAKMMLYSRMAKGEIGGLLSVKQDTNNEILIDDIVLLKQNATYGDFQVDENALFDFLTENRKKAEHFKGWWHSHGEIGAFFSSDDDSTFERLLNMNSFVLGVVINKKNNWNWKALSQSKKGFVLKDEKATIFIDESKKLLKDYFTTKFIEKVKQEITDKVKHIKWLIFKTKGITDIEINENDLESQFKQPGDEQVEDVEIEYYENDDKTKIIGM